MKCCKRFLFVFLVLSILGNWSAAFGSSLQAELLEAIKWGDMAQVKNLISRGADVHTLDPEGLTPLIWACAGRHQDIVMLLLASGANVNARARLGHTALMTGAGACDGEVVKLLLDAGADATARDEEGLSALDSAAARGCTEIVKLLLDRGAGLRSGETGEYRSLIFACNYGRAQTAELLLERGADVNARTREGRTVLMLASYRGRHEVVKLLLDRGADVNARDNWGWTALTLACLTGYNEVVKDLLDKGADVNSANNDGKTALMIASARENIDLVNLLLARGVDASLRDRRGRTATIQVRESRQGNVRQVSQTKPDVIVVEPPTKIAQLVGEYDREAKRATANRTLSRYKLIATDLGVPFRHKGRTYLLFGDTAGIRGGDPIAYTTDTNPEDGLDLEFIHDATGAYKPIEIPGISRDDFEVPVAGTSVGGRMYIYFTTDHSKDTYMGRCVVAASDDDGLTFSYLYDFSTTHFINVSVVQADLSGREGFPESSGTGLVIFGSGPLRKSNIRLAFQPAEKIEEPLTLRYFSGLDESQKPRWSSSERDAVPLFGQPYAWELSVTFNRFIRKWIMLYTFKEHPMEIHMRTADNPWGPWSEALMIFEPSRDRALCRFMHSSWTSERCDVLHEPGWEKVNGVCYGPYQFEEMAVGDEFSTTIYFTLSTWNPYTVILMKMKLSKIAGSS